MSYFNAQKTTEQLVENGLVSTYASYYRVNPAKFVTEYLHIKLNVFQKILVVIMFWSARMCWSVRRKRQ